MEPKVVVLEITQAATTEVSLEKTTATAASEVPQEVTTEATTEAAVNDTVVTSELPTSRTEAPERPLITHAATAQTAAPTKGAEVVQTSGTAAATTESSGDKFGQERTVGEERARHACTATKQRVPVMIISSGWNNVPTFLFGFFGLSPPDGLTTGQAAGIVIGALSAVAIVIAVAIVVARRMGKYS